MEIVANFEGDHSLVNYQTQTSGNGATVEVAKKPRGRPKGSKNKPKLDDPVPARHDDMNMAPYVVEVPPGNDVVQAISQFSFRNNTGLCVLSASGTVLNATLRLPSAASASHVTCPGHYVILSMSAAFGPHQSPTSTYALKPLAVMFAAPNGQVIGGLVSGSLVSMGPVYLIASSFNRPSYHRLAYEDEWSVLNTRTGERESRHVPFPPILQN